MLVKAKVRQVLINIIQSVLPEGTHLPEDISSLHLANDLGMDSLAIISLIVLCEQELDVRISEDPEFITNVSTLDNAVDYLVDNNLVSEQKITLAL